MTIGLGIFLSAILFSTVAMYGLTRNRWNWWRIGKICGVTFGLGVLGVGAWVAYLQWGQRPRPVTEYYGARLGMPMSEIEYIEGDPAWVLGPPELVKIGASQAWLQPATDSDKLPKGKTVDDYTGWGWRKNDIELDITFDKANGKVIEVGCSTDVTSTCKPLLGITIGTTEKKLKEELGLPSHQKIDGGTKTIKYGSLNAVFYLMQQKVYWMGYVHTRGAPHLYPRLEERTR